MDATSKQGVMSLTILDRQTLHASYMPFVRNGGLFIPTDRLFELGDEVFVLLRLMDEPQRYPITGKVIWINPPGAPGGRPPGVGIQFNSLENSELQEKIVYYLAESLQSEQATHTM